MDYKTVTITKHIIPCGNIHCIFVEDKDCFHKLFIKAPTTRKECGDAWIEPVARLITYAMRRATWEGTIEDGIIKQLLGVRCGIPIANKEHFCSCSDAIGKILKQYLKMKEAECHAPTLANVAVNP